jgi:starch phosphorylase
MLQLATRNVWHMAQAYTAHDGMLSHWVRSQDLYMRDIRFVSYLSAEFLMEPHLGNSLISLGIDNEVGQAVKQLGLELDNLLEQGEKPDLGSGGLGRLAACFVAFL